MRRSGITSRSKCAIFSISQMSCSSAGPRGPAVMMLVLSATGAPMALVNLVVDMLYFRVCDKRGGFRGLAFPSGAQNGFGSASRAARNARGPSAPPGRSTNYAAEIAAPESRVLVREHVGLDVAECRVGLVLDAVVERLDDVFLE